MTDLIIGAPGAESMDKANIWSQLREHFSEAEIAEVMLGVGLFHGMSKVLITLGLEPDEMPVTIVPTPGS